MGSAVYWAFLCLGPHLGHTLLRGRKKSHQTELIALGEGQRTHIAKPPSAGSVTSSGEQILQKWESLSTHHSPVANPLAFQDSPLRSYSKTSPCPGWNGPHGALQMSVGAAALFDPSTCPLVSCLRDTECPEGRNHILFTRGILLA